MSTEPDSAAQPARSVRCFVAAEKDGRSGWRVESGWQCPACGAVRLGATGATRWWVSDPCPGCGAKSEVLE